LDGKRVDAAMDVGVGVLVEGLDDVQDGRRLLRRRRVVEIDERLTVDAAGEDREIPADPLDVVAVTGDGRGSCRTRRGAHAASLALASLPPRNASTSSRTQGTVRREARSAAKP